MKDVSGKQSELELYILRHAPAVERAPSGLDRDRRLSAEGSRQMRRIARGMRRLDLRFDRILSSPYERALATAKIVADILGLNKRVKISDHLAGHNSAPTILEAVRLEAKTHAKILVVGHEPNLSETIGLLAGGSGRFAVELKKGGLCKLASHRLNPGESILKFLLTPKQLEQLGKK